MALGNALDQLEYEIGFVLVPQPLRIYRGRNDRC